MPAASWRIMPARSISRCETISASLGVSLQDRQEIAGETHGLGRLSIRAAVLRPLLAFAGRLDKFRPVAVRRPACTEGSRNRPSVTEKLTLENLTSYLISVKTTPPKPPRADRWLLQDAKTRFSELVRRVRSEGPQHVTVHGRDGKWSSSRPKSSAASRAIAPAKR